MTYKSKGKLDAKTRKNLVNSVFRTLIVVTITLIKGRRARTKPLFIAKYCHHLYLPKDLPRPPGETRPERKFAPTINSVKKFVDDSTLAFGGPTGAFCTRKLVLEPLLFRFFELFRGRLIFAEIRDQFRPQPTGRRAQDNQRSGDHALANFHHLARSYIARRLGGKSVDFNTTRPTSFRRQAPRLKDTNCPKPFVQALRR